MVARPGNGPGGQEHGFSNPSEDEAAGDEAQACKRHKVGSEMLGMTAAP